MFSKKSERKNPEIPTAALPDIIFILLFFFIITSSPKPTQDLVDATIPTTERAQLANAKYNLEIRIGKPVNSKMDDYAIQIGNELVKLEQVSLKIQEYRDTKMDPSDRGKQIVAYISGDIKARVGFVRDLENQLRDAGVYTIVNKTSIDK